MAITTSKVVNPKINGVYQVDDRVLGINTFISKQHNVIVTAIDKNNNKVKVKTITSLEKKKNKDWIFKNKKLTDVRNGNILVIPKVSFKTKVLSGVNHNEIEIDIDKLHYKEPGDKTMFPSRYHDLIHKK